MKIQIYECTNCGQNVQGFEASQQIQCCDDKDMTELQCTEQECICGECK